MSADTLLLSRAEDLLARARNGEITEDGEIARSAEGDDYR